MALDQIDRIIRDYTDKYVSVTDAPPSLARFQGLVGQVKTVNMNGRALVEFLNYHQNIGWYDIDLDYLRIVDKPVEPEPVEAKVVAKPKVAKPGGKKLSPLEMLRQQGGSKPAKAKLSPLEQLRQQGGTKKKNDATAAKPKLSPIEQLRLQGGSKSGGKPTAGKAESSTAPTESSGSAKSPPKKSSTADILAKLRQQGDGKE